MGYNTSFSGIIKFNKAMSVERAAELTQFCQERHEGEQWPSIHCDWELTGDLNGLRWNGSEKSYSMDRWLQLLINHFCLVEGIICNGIVEAYGEDFGDLWRIKCTNNKVLRQEPCIAYE